jgi:hypothetical protein
LHFHSFEDEKSYLLIFNTDTPEVLVKKFEIPQHSLIRSYMKIFWSLDGRYVVMPFAMADLSTGELRVIPKQNCGVAGILAGPRMVLNCSIAGASRRIRIIDGSGAILREWAFAYYATVLDVASDVGKMAVHFADPGGTDGPPRNEIAMLDTADREEMWRWPLSGQDSYFGTFLKSGTKFCALQLAMATLDREFLCWDTSSGAEVSHTRLGAGFNPTIIGAGDNVGLEHYDVKHVPKLFWTLFETTFVETNHMRWIWDVKLGRKIAQWPTKSQRVFRGLSAPLAWTISPTGDAVAEGGAGVITIYRLSP